MPTGDNQAGFTYLLLLVWLSVLALMLLRNNDHLQSQLRQDRETQLLFAGDQIRSAILHYRENPAGKKCFPAGFQQLLKDSRSTPVRYSLRRLYPDPFSQKVDWGMVYDDKQRWIGVYSKARGMPLKKEGFPRDYQHFKNASSYADWIFKVDEDPNAPLPEACN